MGASRSTGLGRPARVNHLLSVGSLVLSFSVLGAACGRAGSGAGAGAGPATSAETSAATTTTAVGPALLPPLAGESLERMDLPRGKHAYLALPVGAREKRAIVVGVHGAGDRADWSCSEWQATTAGWAFVVCPEGVRHPTAAGTFVWGSAEAIALQADEAVAAVRARYGAYVEDGPLVYAGWSQGGTLASQVIASRPGTYDRAVLVEVGHTPLDPGAVVANLARGGVTRAVISCSSPRCRAFAHDLEGAGRRKGLPVRVNDVGNRGHVFDGPVVRTLAPALAWMVDDQARYAGLGAAVDAQFSTD
ncbi:MAG: hypothetical protein JWP97_223 [Labilithrix sp.]|nr:hypothetical protein [Labilithrix sp.]